MNIRRVLFAQRITNKHVTICDSLCMLRTSNGELTAESLLLCWSQRKKKNTHSTITHNINFCQ